jgi:hypothetical protein
MASYWLKIDKTTPDKPEIHAIGAILGMSSDEAFSKCFRVWAWADEHTTTGHARRVTLSVIDAIARHVGFADAMITVGWLAVEGDGGLLDVSIPNFDRHMGEGAKGRVLAAKRKKKSRYAEHDHVTEMSRSDRDICHGNVTQSASPEQNRTEYIRGEPPYPPSSPPSEPSSPPSDAADLAARFVFVCTRKRPGGLPIYTPGSLGGLTSQFAEMLRHVDRARILAEIERPGRNRNEWLGDMERRLLPRQPSAGGMSPEEMSKRV